MNKKQEFFGFTLIELLIVIALLGFLSITGLSMFQGSQRRTRDNRRKSDLQQVTKALEMYANDYNGYPEASSGKMKGCVTGTTVVNCEWGSPWVRGVTYMQRIPKDPSSGSYCYDRDISGKWYKLYAQLEATDDPDYNAGLTCGGVSTYSYVLLSPNLTPTPKP